MSYEDHLYHSEREQHCRSMAELAADRDVRQRHEELANLHATRAAQFGPSDPAGDRAAI